MEGDDVHLKKLTCLQHAMAAMKKRRKKDDLLF